MSCFGDAIQLLPVRGVRSAFDEANQAWAAQHRVKPLDSANLSRYKSGQHPSEGFVQKWIPAIARHCAVDHAPLWDAWRTDAQSRLWAQRRSAMLTMFEQFSPREKRELLDLMHGAVGSDLPVRTAFRLQIDVAPTRLEKWNRLTVRSEWSGAVPAGATVATARSVDELEAAYDDSSCVYRELVPGDDESLAEAYERLELPAPLLSYVHDEVDVRLEAKPVGDRPGLYAFSNDPLESGRFRLYAAFPYPADVVCHPVSLNRYSVQGRAYVSINVNRLDCRWVDAFPYGYHSRVKVEVDDPGDLTRVVQFGSDAGALPQGVGVVFLWGPLAR